MTYGIDGKVRLCVHVDQVCYGLVWLKIGTKQQILVQPTQIIQSL
jgi:hypothetical protein